MTNWSKFALATVFILISFSIGYTTGILLTHPPAILPVLVPIRVNSSLQTSSYTFSYQSLPSTITIPLNASVYFGAKYSDKNAILYGNVPKKDWLPQYYNSFLYSPSEDDFFSHLLGQLRGIRTKRDLNDDEYLELVTTFVQSIPYSTFKGDTPPKFPIETYADRTGDCDDKSLLLASLLARDGYNVSIFYFEDEEHMAVGVAGPGCEYRDTGYIYIETTNASAVGVAPKRLAGGIPLNSDPMVIRVGNGTRIYQSCKEEEM
ncbi:MAG TPA: hypothetical protein VE134_06705 [Methanomicrobiales archaeon]|nr:hypothetical protein [Methanomicrobiales archaeon]